MKAVELNAGDIIKMKKKHPCGCDTFTVLRAGSDIRIRCDGCRRDITVERIKLESKIKKVIRPDNIDNENKRNEKDE